MLLGASIWPAVVMAQAGPQPTTQRGLQTAGKAAALTLPLTELGYPSTTRLNGAQAEAAFAIPVDPAVRPRQLSFTVTGSPNVIGGYLEVVVDGQTLATLPHQAEAQRHQVKLPATPSTSGADQLTIFIRAINEEADTQVCDPESVTWQELSQLEVEFTVTNSAPDSIRQFWTPALRQLRLEFADRPSYAMLQAATQVVSFAQRNNLGQVVEVTTQPTLSATPDYGPGRRTVQLVTAAEPSIRLQTTADGQATALVIAGPDQQLPALIQNTLSGLQKEALLTTSVTELPPAVELPTDRVNRLSLAELGFTPPTTSGTNSFSRQLTISQASFRQPWQAAQLEITGQHSALAAANVATLNLLWNNELVASQNLAADGDTTFRLRAELQPAQLRRDNQLTIRVEYSGQQGQCRDLHPLTLTIDPTGSSLSVQTLQEYQPLFDRYPQVIFPASSLVVDAGEWGDVTAALQLVALLQRLTNQPLPLTPVSWDELALRRQPLIAVTADDRRLAQLGLTQTISQYRSNALLSGRYAMLHAFTYQQYPAVLLLSSQWPEGNQALLLQLRQLSGWYSLNQDMFLLSQSGQYAQFNVPDASPEPYLYAGVAQTGFQPTPQNRPLWIGALIILSLVTPISIALVVIKHRWVQRRRAQSQQLSSSAGVVATAPAAPEAPPAPLAPIRPHRRKER